MNALYVVAESMSITILLVLLYANYFGVNHRTKKRSLFTVMLVICLLITIIDLVTWIDLGWENFPSICWLVNGLTYIIPFFALIAFSEYIYEHISNKYETNKNFFRVIEIISMLGSIVFTILCFTGKIFIIVDGQYSPGEWEGMYYLFYIIVLFFISVIIIINREKLKTHELVSALSFSLVPLFATFVSLSEILPINISVPSISIDMMIIYIFLQSEREFTLLYQSNSDELTGLMNRRAYEEDIMNYPKIPVEPNFAYAIIDINGLKVVNDTLGHAAGDELITGAALCLKRTFGVHGRVYRVGGDEFVSMFYADSDKCKFLMEDLENLCTQWRGKLADSLSVSIGCATKSDFPNQTIHELSEIAEKRMYRDKELYYAHKGVDRRGQKEAHKALCAMYTKILKIDITDDSFSIVNMDIDEQTMEKGYANTISEWLENFGRSGNVHPEDLEEYLAKTNLDYMRGYFKRKKASLSIIYHRKYNDGFKRVMMEILPAGDYSDEHQTLFLYVKNIDV